MTSEKERRRPKEADIVRAAAELFVEHGYDGASTEMIAEKAGVSRQTIYNQFESKEGLFLAIASELVHDIAAPLAEAVEGTGDLRGTLIGFGRRMLWAFLSPRKVALYRLVVTEVPRFPQLARSVYESGLVEAENVVASYFSGQSQLRIGDGRLAAQHFLALLAYPYEFKTQLGIGTNVAAGEIDHHVDAAVDAFLRAYG